MLFNTDWTTQNANFRHILPSNKATNGQTEALLSVLSEDNWVRSGARERYVPLRCLNHTSRPKASLLICSCYLFKKKKIQRNSVLLDNA